MIDEAKLRRDLIQFIQESLSLKEFEDRLVRMSWDMHRDSSASAVALASAIELRLAEHSCGHLSDADLRDELRVFAHESTMQIDFGAFEKSSSQEMVVSNTRLNQTLSKSRGATVPVDRLHAVELC